MTKFKQKLTTLILPLLLVTAFFAGGLLSISKPVANAEGATVINPIAKYEFKDASNLGKDSMGNYDMVELSVDANGKALQGATLLQGGGVSFNDNFCVAQSAESNMFADVTAFTLCFEIMTDVDGTVDAEQWEHYIGVSRKYNKSNHLSFIGRGLTDYKGQLRIFERSMLKNADNSNTSAETSALKIDSANEKVKPTEFKRIVVSVQPGGKIAVYFNADVVSLGSFTGDVPEGFSYVDDNKSFFSIGGRYGLDANATSKGFLVDKTATGSIRNVQFYDFAMDATCVSAYDTNGYITADDISGTKITGAEVDFGGETATSEELNTEMSTNEMFALLNDANAVLKLSNDTTVN
ncbi:MAG: hypothetical protein IJW47_00050, partial [Clostridia bacterium]|nr:hypothetical protein [Clostridia bacterium]